MSRFVVEFEANWEPRKVIQADHEIHRLIKGLYGVSNYGGIKVVEGDGQVAPPPPLLKLSCNNKSFGKECGFNWEAETFTPCPKCGQKRFVHKSEVAAA